MEVFSPPFSFFRTTLLHSPRRSHLSFSPPFLPSTDFHEGKQFIHQLSNTPGKMSYRLGRLTRLSAARVDTRAVRWREQDNFEKNKTPWDDDKPYELLPGGRRFYIDEQDIATLLDPPKELIPLDPASYNPAAYLWKKIGDIPEERRHRLLFSLKPRLISRMWEIAGARYDDDKLAKSSASHSLTVGAILMSCEYWTCRTSGVRPLLIAWIDRFKKVLFTGINGKLYGRMFLGGSILLGVTSSLSPFYFTVTHVNKVMATENPCDLAYVFGNGLLDPYECPEGFPKPKPHPRPFNDQVVVYIRHVGPGVMVGQAWQEGLEMEQVPKKFCGEILMVRDNNLGDEQI